MPVSDKPIFCRACVEAKSTRYPLNKRREEPLQPEAPRPGYAFDGDVAGPFRCKTKGGNSYLSLLVDAYSKRIFGVMIKTPSAFFEEWKLHVKRIEAEFGRGSVVAQLRTDGARYYEVRAALRDFNRARGIVQLFSPPYTQALNGTAERAVRTVMEMARTMMLHSGVPRSLYGEALLYAIYILNRLPRGPDNECALEMWRGHSMRDPLAHARTFGCAAFVHLVHATGPGPNVDKWDAKSMMQ